MSAVINNAFTDYKVADISLADWGRKEINIAKDRIASATDDKANKKLLGLMRRGDSTGLQKYLPAYAGAARADMVMKHLTWIMGALRWRFGGAKVLAYGPAYGSGAAVVEILL